MFRLGLYAQLGMAILLMLIALGRLDLTDPNSWAQGVRRWSAPPTAKAAANPIPSSPASLANGQELFSEYCVMCHGPKGKGDGAIAASLTRPPADLSHGAGLVELTDGEIFWRISRGDDIMPNFERAFSLSPEDRWHLVNYVRLLGR